jgi:hypothetical protein
MFLYNPETVVRCARCGRKIQLGFARFPANEQFTGDAVAKAFCLPHGKGLTFAELEFRATARPADLPVVRHLHEVRGQRPRAAA